MKKQALTLTIVLSLLLVAGSAFAQTISLKADIPFKFVVNDKTMPAGQYSLASLNSLDDRNLVLASADNKQHMLINANSAASLQPSQQTRLIFEKYGDRYFLSQIWVAGNDAGHALRQSKREKEVAMDYQPEQVVVLASLR